jgi:transposase
MPKPISNEERNKIIKHKKNGETDANMAHWIFVSKSAVAKILGACRNTETHLLKYSNCGRKSVISDDDILLLDNSSVHESRLVLDTLAACKIRFLFLPRYSPDFNPIEFLLAYMKSMLRKLKARTHEKLEQAVGFALHSVPPSFISNWFRHCGYKA